MATDAKQIAFNLDTYEGERVNAEPFIFSIGEDSFEMTDAADLDWQQLLEIEDPTGFFRYCMREEDKPRFLEKKVSGRQMGGLIEAYMKHFGIGPNRSKIL